MASIIFLCFSDFDSHLFYLFIFALICSYSFSSVLICSYLLIFVLICSSSFLFVPICSFLFLFVLVCSYLFIFVLFVLTHFHFIIFPPLYNLFAAPVPRPLSLRKLLFDCVYFSLKPFWFYNLFFKRFSSKFPLCFLFSANISLFFNGFQVNYVSKQFQPSLLSLFFLFFFLFFPFSSILLILFLHSAYIVYFFLSLICFYFNIFFPFLITFSYNS